jgi:hypothetical protein
MTDDDTQLRDLLQRATPGTTAIGFDAVAARRRHRRNATVASLSSGALVVAVIAAVVVATTGAHRPVDTGLITGPSVSIAGDIALTRDVPCPKQGRAQPTRRAGTTVSPSTFHPVTALRCIFAERTIPGRGKQLVRVRQVTAGNLTALQSAYAATAIRTHRGFICSDVAILAPGIALVDSTGHWIEPVVPLDACGQPLPQLFTAVNGLAWKDVSVRRVHLPLPR